MPLILWLVGMAHAAEVVWLAPPPADAVATVMAQAGATGPAVPVAALAGRAHAWRSDVDGAALEAIETTLRDVRPFEQRMDGELLIMRDLQAPLDAVVVIRDDKDRDVVFAALAYQGFAVERFYEHTLADDERGAPYRATVGDRVVPRPWLDAIALDPQRGVTAYEIAEAPQRVAYEAVRVAVNAALPATLAIPELPEGAVLVIDGRPVEPDIQRIVRTVPGRHHAHVVLGDRIVARWTGRVEAGGRIEVPLSVSTDLDWVAALPVQPPKSVLRDLRALDDEVWLVDPTGKQPTGWRFADGTFAPLVLDKPTSDTEVSATAGFAAGPGWMSTADYYRQDPIGTQPDFATVNAPAAVVTASAGVDAGRARLEAGMDLWWTPGAAHVAAWRDRSSHLRAFPHVAVGIPELRAAIGWLTPHHVGLGPRLALPLGKVEVVGNGTVGLSVVGAQPDGTWSGAPVWSAWAGVGMRFCADE